MAKRQIFTNGVKVGEEDIPDPTGPTVRTREQLKAAMKAIDATKYAAAMTDARLSYFLTRLAVTETFTKDSAELIEGIDTLVGLGLWSAQNKADFLAGWQ